MVDELVLSPGSGPGDGTSVTIRVRPHSATHLFATPAVAGPVGGYWTGRFQVRTEERHDEQGANASVVLRLAGPVHLASAPEMRLAVRRAAEDGARPVVVDLSAVTLLASAGVRELVDARTELPEVALVAGPGSVAHRVLDLVQLPHRTAWA